MSQRDGFILCVWAQWAKLWEAFTQASFKTRNIGDDFFIFFALD
jgi:hypothetical protein